MRIVVAGAGAMGCRYGWKLFEANHDVLLADFWKDHVQAIQQNGLEVTTETSTLRVPISATEPEHIKGAADLILVLTKATQTESFMTHCRHLIGNHTYALTLQNGLGNVEVLEKFVPRNRLLAGVTMFATELIHPGSIVALGSGSTYLAPVGGDITHKIQLIVDTFQEAGLNAILSTNLQQIVWNKVAFNCVLNPLSTLMRASVMEVGSYSNIHELISYLLDEIMLVAKMEQVYLDKEQIMTTITEQFNPATSGHHLASMFQDIMKGQKTEIEFLNGAIVKYANRHHVSVPCNRLIVDLICMLEQIREQQTNWDTVQSVMSR
ncbi:ketopantoate reductase family protein [Alicyclobacillus dauci]|uniref:2-dehydropantoate 2-reductase n=1 Tax=Alicyclobacillus dauci TaxID=1475485 RepID=A0ABY6YYM2_9BACL|nr:2-dehydropantoate 2-reductase [Alicyclobacillus dauci]WAH35671.1 2-dehydropantoate 2-reductase [Alicyclobacillus dauci]